MSDTSVRSGSFRSPKDTGLSAGFALDVRSRNITYPTGTARRKNGPTQSVLEEASATGGQTLVSSQEMVQVQTALSQTHRYLVRGGVYPAGHAGTAQNEQALGPAQAPEGIADGA
jgi:hypothetical protein